MRAQLAQGGNRRCKRPEPLPQASLDEPFGPPPEEYLERCPVGRAEMLVNEAIMDVAIGMAKVHGEYTGGMPTLVDDHRNFDRCSSIG
jgi:hypothetical protein